MKSLVQFIQESYEDKNELILEGFLSNLFKLGKNKAGDKINGLIGWLSDASKNMKSRIGKSLDAVKDKIKDEKAKITAATAIDNIVKCAYNAHEAVELAKKAGVDDSQSWFDDLWIQLEGLGETELQKAADDIKNSFA